MIPLNEKSKNRIQIIRAIAIISVLVIHTVGQSPYELYIRPLVNFGVGVFLFLSGFLTPHIEDVKVFYTKEYLGIHTLPSLVTFALRGLWRLSGSGMEPADISGE